MAIFAVEMETELTRVSARTVGHQPHAIAHGALLLCRKGRACVRVNFDRWPLAADSFIIFYPGDIVGWESASTDFGADILRYPRDILRSASMNIEHEVYRQLRDDRTCDNHRLIEEVVKGIFFILGFYFNDPYTPSIDRIVAMQMQAFFIGFADYMRYNPESRRLPHGDSGGDGGSPRARQLFAAFMQTLEEHFHESHEAAFYARRMNISTKYLARIAREHTGLSPKRIIDDYVVEQLKLALRGTTQSLKEVAAAFHFSDPSALTRYFKAHGGCTPTEFRMR